MWKGLPARPLIFSLWTYAAFASPHRALLQAAADIVAEDQFAPVFQLVWLLTVICSAPSCSAFP